MYLQVTIMCYITLYMTRYISVFKAYTVILQSYIICSVPQANFNLLYNKLYLPFQGQYRDVLNIYNLLYHRLKTGVCLVSKMSTSAKLKGYGQYWWFYWREQEGGNREYHMHTAQVDVWCFTCILQPSQSSKYLFVS